VLLVVSSRSQPAVEASQQQQQLAAASQQKYSGTQTTRPAKITVVMQVYACMHGIFN